MQRMRQRRTAAVLRDQLEPFWEDVDGVVSRRLRPVAPHACYLYFESCRVKLKMVYYHLQRIEELDARYGELVDALLEADDRKEFESNPDGTRSYHPFFEAMEFESLLLQAKACVDSFSRGTGATFGDPAAKLSKLIQVLNQQPDAEATQLHNIATRAQERLKGIVLDPDVSAGVAGRPARKSVRDLVGHYGAGAIHFRIDRQGRRSTHALMRKDDRLRLPTSNQTVVSVSKNAWYHTLMLIRDSLPLVVAILERREPRMSRRTTLAVRVKPPRSSKSGRGQSAL